MQLSERVEGAAVAAFALLVSALVVGSGSAYLASPETASPTVMRENARFHRAVSALELETHVTLANRPNPAEVARKLHPVLTTTETASSR